MRAAYLRRTHLLAAMLGTGLILIFWTSTVTIGIVGSTEAIIGVKQAIAWALLALVPALLTAGATGFALGGRSKDPRILAKRRRMPVISGIGLFVLVPSAAYLARAAGNADFGSRFYIVQAVELVAGAINLTLMTLNVRDGFRVTRRRPARSGPRAA